MQTSNDYDGNFDISLPSVPAIELYLTKYVFKDGKG
jgi:hypothetical protein